VVSKGLCPELFNKILIIYINHSTWDQDSLEVLEQVVNLQPREDSKDGTTKNITKDFLDQTIRILLKVVAWLKVLSYKKSVFNQNNQTLPLEKVLEFFFTKTIKKLQLSFHGTVV